MSLFSNCFLMQSKSLLFILQIYTHLNFINIRYEFFPTNVPNIKKYRVDVYYHFPLSHEFYINFYRSLATELHGL